MRFGDVMTRSVVTIRADASVREATRLLIKHRRGSLGARLPEIRHKIEFRKLGSKRRRGAQPRRNRIVGPPSASYVSTVRSH